MANDIEVYIDFAPGLRRVGTLHRQARRGGEAVSFEYHPDWLGEPARFSLEPALTLDRGAASREPACLMAFDPQPPGEVRANAHSVLGCESVLSIRS